MSTLHAAPLHCAGTWRGVSHDPVAGVAAIATPGSWRAAIGRPRPPAAAGQNPVTAARSRGGNGMRPDPAGRHVLRGIRPPSRISEDPARRRCDSRAGRLLVALCLLGAAASHARDPAPDGAHQRAASPFSPSPIVVPVDATARASLTRHHITADAGAVPQHCEGVSLVALLQAHGAMPEAELQDDQLDRYVRIDDRDGARVLFSLAELDPTLGGRAVYLVDRCDNAPLDAVDGPLRLLVPGDARPTRGLRRVHRIIVVAAP